MNDKQHRTIVALIYYPSLALGLFLLTVLLGSFIKGEIDPLEWSSSERISAVLFWFASLWIAGMFHICTDPVGSIVHFLEDTDHE